MNPNHGNNLEPVGLPRVLVRRRRRECEALVDCWLANGLRKKGERFTIEGEGELAPAVVEVLLDEPAVYSGGGQ